MYLIFDDNLQWALIHLQYAKRLHSFYLFWITYLCKCFDSLALSLIKYALPVGVMQYLNRLYLQHLLNRVVCITKSLSKHNHVFHHSLTLNQLSVASQIQQCSLCAMYHHYHPSYPVLFDQLCLVSSIRIVPNVLRISNLY